MTSLTSMEFQKRRNEILSKRHNMPAEISNKRQSVRKKVSPYIPEGAHVICSKNVGKVGKPFPVFVEKTATKLKQGTVLGIGDSVMNCFSPQLEYQQCRIAFHLQGQFCIGGDTLCAACMVRNVSTAKNVAEKSLMTMWRKNHRHVISSPSYLSSTVSWSLLKISGFKDNQHARKGWL